MPSKKAFPFSNDIASSARRFLYSKALPNRSLRRRPLEAEKVSADPNQSASRQQKTHKVALDALSETQQSARSTYTRKSSNRSDDENIVGVSKSDCGTGFVRVYPRTWDHCSNPASWDDDFLKFPK